MSTQGTVGDCRPTKPLRHSVCLLPGLEGESALVGANGVAQFDRVETGYGYGWHQFSFGDFDHRAPNDKGYFYRSERDDQDVAKMLGFRGDQYGIRPPAGMNERWRQERIAHRGYMLVDEAWV